MPAAPVKKDSSRKSGFAYWMAQVVKEAARASEAFAPDPVHDLRVALRRCRSMSEVIQSFDPDPAWRKMRKAGKQVFSSLGDLRDCQVLIEWVTRLSGEGDPVRARLLAHLMQEELRLKGMASQSLQSFDFVQWQERSMYLSGRITHHSLDGELFQGLALARWHDARELHRTAVRTRSKIALHRLRIGVKKFRYVVENFLPKLHARIEKSVKEVQDLLGEVHDLDVLWETTIRIHAFAGPEDRLRWSEIVQQERNKRIERYKQLAHGHQGIWQEWRSHLPSDAAADRASRKRIQTWSSLLDPDPAHSRRVATIALKVYDSLVRDDVFRGPDDKTRKILDAAATMHDVGKDGKERSHHKKSYKLISKFQLPYGWTEEDLRIAALTARYHRGALPNLRQKNFRRLSRPARTKTMQLAAIVRFANALDHAQRGVRSRIIVRQEEQHILITSSTFVNGSPEAERLAGARYLLELVCNMPIVVRGDNSSPRSGRRRPTRPRS